LERSHNPGFNNITGVVTLKGFANRQTLSGLIKHFVRIPQGCRSRSNPGLTLANAFGVNRAETNAFGVKWAETNVFGVNFVLLCG
jgi:hypothetical protein